MTNIDTLVAQAVHQARLIESALHDDAQWTMQVGDAVAAVRREIVDMAVIFTAWFDRANGDVSAVSLLRDGEVVAVRPLDPVGSGEFGVRWCLEAMLSSVA